VEPAHQSRRLPSPAALYGWDDLVDTHISAACQAPNIILPDQSLRLDAFDEITARAWSRSISTAIS
jgi:hypothetical protein